MYYNARYYDPQLGMFISPNSIVPDPTNVFAYNRYMYVYGNPLKYSDPSGHCPVCVIFVLAAVGLGIEGSVSSGPSGSYVDTPPNANGQMAVSVIAGDVNDLAIVATGYDYVLMEPVPYDSEGWGDAAVMMVLPVASRSSYKLLGEGLQQTVAQEARMTQRIAPVQNHKAISMDDALDQASDFMDAGTPIRSVDQPSGVQFIQEFTDASGNRITKRVGIDVNPSSRHVQNEGPHLNLQTQINGERVREGPNSDPHTPIDTSTVRPGDY